MKNFHIKSIILGIGIGIVLTSIISMIYLAGVTPNTKMSKEEIISEAKKIGMVEETRLIGESQQTTSKAGISAENKEVDVKASANVPSEPEKPSNNVTQPVQQKAEQIIDIRVGDGEDAYTVAANLVQKGIISDKDAFINAIRSVRLQGHIKTGDYKIKSGTDVNRIIELITR